MIDNCIDRFVSSNQLWLPFLEGSDNGQEFFIIDVVITLSWLKLLREECDRAKNVTVLLG
jgi:hypothetical protein